MTSDRPTSAYERRREPRVPVDLDLWVMVDGQLCAARIIDLSCSGALISRVGQEPPRLHTIALRFADGRAMRLMARTVRTEPEHYAVAFLALDEVDRLSIAEQMDQLGRAA